MPLSSNGQNGEPDTLVKPKPKSKQRQNLEDNVFVTPKKRRRTEPVKKKAELDLLFDKISNDPFYENELSFIDNRDKPKEPSPEAQNVLTLAEQQLNWLYDGSSDNEDSTSVSDLTVLATSFLEQDQTEQLKLALGSTDPTKANSLNYRFFNKSCKLPNPYLQFETGTFVDMSNKAKYDHIVKYSQSETKRRLLLSSGILPLWHKLGWHCPQSIYRWLIEIVAFDKDVDTARKAKAILTSLWVKLPREKLCMKPLALDDINCCRIMSLETFRYILKSYGALNLPPIDDNDMRMGSQSMDQTAMDEDPTDRIPLTQFEWILILLQRSLTLWPEAYTLQQVHYLATTMICLGMDGIGELVLKHTQDTLDTCLMILPQDTWRYQVQRLAFALCERFPSVELHVKLPAMAKTVYPRSLYLRRVMAVMALELALHNDTSEEKDNKISALSFNTISSSLTLDNDLLARLATILTDLSSLFYQSDPDYGKFADRIYLLDYAIGNDYTELMTSLDAVNSLVTQLQAFSRKIGGCLGALSRTKANEAAQRLWSRLVYVIGQNRNTTEYNEL